MKNDHYLLPVVVLTLLVLVPLFVQAQDRRYFPDVGREAVHQRALDLSNNAVVLMVALQPGYEDLNLLARLRLGVGAKTFVLYWTNGEATPDDAAGASPGYLAAVRREEAFRAATRLGAQTQYLNLPDPGVVRRQESLEQAWNPDSTLPKLKAIIRSYGPDIVVLCGDFRGDTVQSARQRLLTGLTLRAVREAAEKSKEDSLRAGPWRVQRVLVQKEEGKGKRDQAYNQVHPLWKISYRSIAREAVREYESLRYQLPPWLDRGDAQYVQLFPSRAPAPKQLTAGVPVVSRRIRPLAALVRNAAGNVAKGVRSTSLAPVVRAIDSLNLVLAKYRSALSAADLRVVSIWKNGLEDLRCSLLDVSIAYQSSDSLVTQAQLFYVNFPRFSSRTSKTNTRILFPPVMEKKWAVNESATYQYDFAPPQEYRIITPVRMEFDHPGSQFGMVRPFARTRFTFLIFHQDSLPGRDFVYRGEILLHAAPVRTFELMTPGVRALEGEPVVYRLQNISRDEFTGTISLTDSILHSATNAVRFKRKDEVILDTLFLSFKEPPPSGTSTVTLSLSGLGGKMPVVIRRFEAAVDSSARVVLLSGITDSPVAQALRRLRIPFQHVHGAREDALALANVMILDRDGLAAAPLSSEQAEALGTWVRRGGHLVVFPQLSNGQGFGPLAAWARFASGPLGAPDEGVIVAATHPLLTSPNVIEEADWSNWVVSRTMSPLALTGQAPAVDVPVRRARGNTPLLATREEGEGRITLVALDLASQLMNLHPGAHRLLGNLLRVEK